MTSDKRPEYSDRIANLRLPPESELGLPDGFFRALLDEDDWSFVIKSHALLEAAFTRLLLARFGDQRLAEALGHMELSGSKVGKLAFASSLGFTTDDERRFVRTFSELRNTLVHDIQNVTFRFSTYTATLDTNQRKAFQRAFFYPLLTAPEADRASMMASAMEDPRYNIWAATMLLIQHLRLHITAHAADVANREMYAEAGRILRDLREGETFTFDESGVVESSQ